VAGALAERVFADKMANVGFTTIEVRERRPVALDDASSYTLFTPDLVQLMRDLLTPEQQAEIAVAMTVTARKPRAGRRS
jgi:arsenite methyltransferase